MKKGFTLIEVLGVIILLSVIIVIIMPNIINSIKKANKQGDIYKINLKVVFKLEDKYYSNYAKTNVIEDVTSYEEALAKLEKANYTMTFKKVNNHYVFVSSNLVK